MLIETKKLKDLKAAPYNPRKSNEKQENHLKASLEKYGCVEPIIFNKQTGYIVGGHFRVRELKKLGYKDVDCVIVDLNEEDEKELNIRLNANTGEWDWELLDSEGWSDCPLEEWGLELPDDDREDGGKDLKGKDDDYQAPDNLQVDVVLGDLIEIGVHRLLCGDSTDSDAVAGLWTAGVIKKTIVISDPPYGIDVVKNEMVGADFGIAKKGKYEKVIADETTDTAESFYNTCVALGINRFILFGGNYFVKFLPFSDGWLIWNKRAGTDIRNTFADGEMAWCSFHTPLRIYNQLWNGMIREGEKEKRVHPTQKPIRILSEIITDHAKEDEIIFDGFLGSGSTMVAAHQLNRKCYGMELDPKYCQVIIDRMAKLDPNLKIKINGVPYEPKTEKVPF